MSTTRDLARRWQGSDVAAPRIDVDAVSAHLVEVSSRVIVPRFPALAAGDVSEKGPDDLVTEADTEAEQLVSQALLAEYPRVSAIREEAVSSDPRLLEHLDELETYWLLDPLDARRTSWPAIATSARCWPSSTAASRSSRGCGYRCTTG
jgi:hypothetical protein